MKRTLAALCAVASIFAVASPAAVRSATERDAAAKAERVLRSQVAGNRRVAWRFEQKAGLPLTPTTHRERRTTSGPFLRWIVRWWHSKAYDAMAAYRSRLAAAAAARSAAASYGGGGGYQGLTGIAYANPYCESGGDPHNSSNPKYRGKWQFDQATWDRFAPAAYRGKDPAFVPESVQDAVATRVTYDAWPRC